MAAVCVGVRMMEAIVSGLLERELSEGELAETIRGLREHGVLRGEVSWTEGGFCVTENRPCHVCERERESRGTAHGGGGTPHCVYPLH